MIANHSPAAAAAADDEAELSWVYSPHSIITQLQFS